MSFCAEELLRHPIVWMKAERPANWSAFYGGECIRLRMNDFPEEPLYTLFFGAESIDIDDPPEVWAIPR